MMEVKSFTSNDFDTLEPKVDIESASTEQLWKDALEMHRERKDLRNALVGSYWNQFKQTKSKILIIGVATIIKFSLISVGIYFGRFH